jgi:RNA polymerase sigma factor (sigma-70 family)
LGARHPNRGIVLKPIDIPPEHAVSDPTDAAQRAFLTLLFNKYRGALLRHVGRFASSREDAADLVQDTYLRVMDRISMSRFDGEARAYLFQTATNLARDHYRRQKFRTHAPLDDAPESSLQAAAPTPEQAIAADQVTAALRAAIGEMPEEARAVFILARSRELSYEDIAKHLGIGRRTVERRVAEAVAFLARRLRGTP